MKRGTGCSLHRHMSKVPLHDHHIQPKEYGGPTTPENMIRICANGHGDTHYYMDLLFKYMGNVPSHLKREFGKKTRDLATRGYLSTVRNVSNQFALQQIFREADQRANQLIKEMAA